MLLNWKELNFTFGCHVLRYKQLSSLYYIYMSVILHFMEHSSSKNSRYEHILHILFLLMLSVKAQAFSIHVRDYKPNN